MSERPFMQLYVSDFIGDTLQLSTEQIGAYMLLLMAMWNADGKLPADDAKLARIVRMSVKKWRAISEDLMAYFDGDESNIWHNRLTKELQKSEAKSQSRAAAGAKGGSAKSLKGNDKGKAIAKQMPEHLPEARGHIAAAQQGAWDKPSLDDLEQKLRDAAGVADDPNPALLNLSPMIGLLEAGYSLEVDILPLIRTRRGKKPRSWSYYIEAIKDAAAERRSHDPVSERPAQISAKDWPRKRWEQALEFCRMRGEWQESFGPPPFAEGCLVPAELLLERDHEFSRKAA